MKMPFRFVKRGYVSVKIRIITTLLGILLALLFSGMLILYAGVNPLVGYYYILKGALGDKLSLTETFVRFSPLLYCGVSVAIAFLCKFYNIGAEGQLYAGGLVATFFGISFLGAPSWYIQPIMILAGFLGGAAWALLPALLKIKLKADEVVTTLLGNWVIYYLTAAILHGPWMNPVSKWPESPAISDSARLPILIKGSRFHLGIVIAIAFLILYYVIFKYTAWGYELRMIGYNPKAAFSMGVKVNRNIILAAILSGGIAGLAGVTEVAGIHFHMKEDLSPGFGYTGIVIAMLGGLHPIGVGLASLFMAIIVTGSQAMHRITGVPYPISEIIQGLSLLFLLVGNFLAENKIERVKE